MLFPLMGLTLHSNAHDELVTTREIASGKIANCDAGSEQTGEH